MRAYHAALAAPPLLAGLSLLSSVNAAPVTFNTALPVSKGEVLFRQQMILTRASDELSGVPRQLTSVQAVSVVGYGPVRRAAVFGVLPVVHIDREFGASQVETTGLGDASIFARYEILRADGPGRTVRAAPFAGLTLPTGDEDHTGDGSLDVFGGLIGTFATTDWVVDGQIQYTANREANGFERGDETRIDASFQYRLAPSRLAPDTNGFVFGIVEINASYFDKDRLFGVADPNSGGALIFVAPGVQYAARRWIAEAAVRIPVARDLNGEALAPDYSVIASLRVNF